MLLVRISVYREKWDLRISRNAPKIIGDQLRSEAAAQEVMPEGTSGEVMRRKTSPEVRLLRRRPLRSTVEWFSVLRKERFQVSDASCKKKKEDLFLKRY